jgi:hypothetical protein
MHGLRSWLARWTQDVPTETPLGETWADLLALVPRHAQRRAIELALIIQGSHAAHVTDATHDGFSQGLEHARQATTPTADDGFKEGFEKGWNRAALDVLAKTGRPAVRLREDDDDEAPTPPDC